MNKEKLCKHCGNPPQDPKGDECNTCWEFMTRLPGFLINCNIGSLVHLFNLTLGELLTLSRKVQLRDNSYSKVDARPIKTQLQLIREGIKKVTKESNPKKIARILRLVKKLEKESKE